MPYFKIGLASAPPPAAGPDSACPAMAGNHRPMPAADVAARARNHVPIR